MDNLKRQKTTETLIGKWQSHYGLETENSFGLQIGPEILFVESLVVSGVHRRNGVNNPILFTLFWVGETICLSCDGFFSSLIIGFGNEHFDCRIGDALKIRFQRCN